MRTSFRSSVEKLKGGPIGRMVFKERSSILVSIRMSIHGISQILQVNRLCPIINFIIFSLLKFLSLSGWFLSLNSFVILLTHH
jgi:hypothetical protein